MKGLDDRHAADFGFLEGCAAVCPSHCTRRREVLKSGDRNDGPAGRID